MNFFLFVLALLIVTECGKSAPNELTTNANQFAGVPLSIKDGVAITNAQLWGAPLVDVTLYGAVGDGSTDNSQAISNSIAAALSYETLYFPAGNYKVTSPIDISTKPLHVLGAGRGGDAFGGSRIFGSLSNQPVIIWNSLGSDNGPTIQALHISNTHTNGTGIKLSGFISGALRDLHVRAWKAIEAQPSVFTLGIENCHVTCIGGVPTNSVGIATWNHCSIRSCDVVGFNHAVRMAGFGTIEGCRIEVNNFGLVLGMTADGGIYAFQGVVLGNSFEANDIGIYAASIANSTVMANSIHGSTGSPSAGSSYGLFVNTAVNCLISSLSTSGTFSGGGIVDAPGAFIENVAYLAVAGKPFSLAVSNNVSAIQVHTNQSTTILQLNP